jgi:autotransporter-associated beta strand protein
MNGSGHYFFTGFQKTILTGVSSHYGINQLYWSQVIVDNPQALGDVSSGSSVVSGADRIGGLYLSNNITWTQPLELDPRQAGITAPHIANWSGTNTITSALTFATGQGGSEINVEATAGLLTIDATSTLANNAGNNPNNLDLQGAATGVWNGVLADSSTALNVLKRGSGTWTLGGVNTYTGTTTVSNGALLVNGQLGAGAVSVESGAILGGSGIIGGAVNVDSGGTLAPGNGIGSLTINNNLTLAGGSFLRAEINKTAATSDQIVGVNTLTYGGTLLVSNLSGTLAAGDAFPLFSATSYTGAFATISPATPGTGLAWNTSTLIMDGTLRVMSGVATNSTNITATVVGGNTLKIAWPADHTGWILQAQTNSLSHGLGTNWSPIASSATTNQVYVPIVTTNGSVFYRLVNH